MQSISTNKPTKTFTAMLVILKFVYFVCFLREESMAQTPRTQWTGVRITQVVTMAIDMEAG